MSPVSEYQMASEHRALLDALWHSEQERGQPHLPADAVESARAYLSLILVDGRAEFAHARLLEEFYRAQFHPPLSRWFWQDGPRPEVKIAAGFRHNCFLPEEKARAIAEQGPGVLSPDELASLLLNPYALWDVGDLIEFLQPDYWLDRLTEVGQELMDRYGLEVPIPGLTEANPEQR